MIKKIDKKIKFLNKVDHKVSNMDLIVLSTHMSQYNNLIKKLLRYISSKNLITDTGSTKRNIENLINKNKKLKKIFIPSHPIAGSEVSGPEFGDKNFNQTYYEVKPSQEIDGRKSYKAKAGLISRNESIEATAQLSKHLRLFGLYYWRKLNSSVIASSPLVKTMLKPKTIIL